MNTEMCANCKYYKLDNRFGRCRRYPPTTEGNYSLIRDTFNWCGEWTSINYTAKQEIPL